MIDSPREIRDYQDAYDKCKILLISVNKNYDIYFRDKNIKDLKKFRKGYKDALDSIQFHENLISKQKTIVDGMKFADFSFLTLSFDIELLKSNPVILLKKLYIDAMNNFSDSYLTCKNLLPYAVFKSSEDEKITEEKKNKTIKSQNDIYNYIFRSNSNANMKPLKFYNSLFYLFDERAFSFFSDPEIWALIAVEHLDVGKSLIETGHPNLTSVLLNKFLDKLKEKKISRSSLKGFNNSLLEFGYSYDKNVRLSYRYNDTEGSALSGVSIFSASDNESEVNLGSLVYRERLNPVLEESEEIEEDNIRAGGGGSSLADLELLSSVLEESEKSEEIEEDNITAGGGGPSLVSSAELLISSLEVVAEKERIEDEESLLQNLESTTKRSNSSREPSPPASNQGSSRLNKRSGNRETPPGFKFKS